MIKLIRKTPQNQNVIPTEQSDEESKREISHLGSK